jgi:adenosylcobyric acid synthase
MEAKVLVVLGTTSSAGKSLLATALCRIYARRGMRVAPFKAQNMSNNAAVCPDGAEIGRAQAVQAAAAGLQPTADMNPILLKPEADARSQVVLMGRPWRTISARSYYERKSELWAAVTASLDRLRSTYDLVIVEGAGSPVEMNLKARDIVNMAVATYAHAPVVLVGDIDRGGVFAQLLGTLWLLEEQERALVKGLIVNKFRGDPTLFEDGVQILEDKGGVPVLGIVPYLHDHGIPEEDAVALDEPMPGSRAGGDSGAGIDIAVVRLPRIANFDDFDPLAAEPGVHLRYVSSPRELGCPEAVILPGTKSTIADLAWLREQGMADAIVHLAGEGTTVVGICGGYQMLGHVIRDPEGVESELGEVPGLGLLPQETNFGGDKTTHQVQARITDGPGWLANLAGRPVSGYEIHMGRTVGGTPWLRLGRRSGQVVEVSDGAVSDDGQVWGCYLHGLFANAELRQRWLASLGWKASAGQATPLSEQEAAFERLADEVESVLDMKRLDSVLF